MVFESIDVWRFPFSALAHVVVVVKCRDFKSVYVDYDYNFTEVCAQGSS